MRPDRYPSQLLSQASGSDSDLFGAVLSRAAIGLDIITGIVFTIPIVFFFLKDGEPIREWFLGLATRSSRSSARR